MLQKCFKMNLNILNSFVEHYLRNHNVIYENIIYLLSISGIGSMETCKITQVGTKVRNKND